MTDLKTKPDWSISTRAYQVCGPTTKSQRVIQGQSGNQLRGADNMEAKSRHIFIVVWGAVEILLFGGTIFGWASLVYIYKKDGYFGYLCDEDHPHGNVSATETWLGEGTSYVTPSSTDLYHTFDVMVTSYPSTNNISHPGVNRLNTGRS